MADRSAVVRVVFSGVLVAAAVGLPVVLLAEGWYPSRQPHSSPNAIRQSISL